MSNKLVHSTILAVLFVGGTVLAPVLSSSAPPSQELVGHVMALLSIFEQANVLPPEDSREANELIHALIQTQAALTKSTHPATRRWFSEALQASGVEQEGLTSRALEGILVYSNTHPPQNDPAILAGFKAFNVTPADFAVMARVYHRAVTHFQATGQDIHVLYEQQRQTMPFR